MRKHKKGQHFLLKAKSRTMSLKEIFKLTDREAHNIFKNLRWKNGIITCPNCAYELHYWIETRKLWQCKGCKKQFSVTSGTIFAYHKLKLQDYLGAIAILSNSAKNHAMLNLSRDLNVQYKTAFVLSHKIREALMNHRDLGMMKGELEVDVAWFGGYVKVENRKEDRIDRRLAENQSGKKRAILTIRKRSGFKKSGAVKTLTFMLRSENQDDIKSIVERFVSEGSLIHADENVAYNLLHARFEMKRVDHSKEYFNRITKACTNQAESFFARLKRSQIGQHHKMNPTYLPYYANEIAFREDTRRWDNGSIFENIVYKAMHSPMSFEMKGYWQNNKRRFERIGV